MSNSDTNFFDDWIARAPRQAGAALCVIGIVLLGWTALGLHNGDYNEFAVIVGPGVLACGLVLVILGKAPQWLQTVAGVAGLGLGCLALKDLKWPDSVLLKLF